MNPSMHPLALLEPLLEASLMKNEGCVDEIEETTWPSLLHPNFAHCGTCFPTKSNSSCQSPKQGVNDSTKRTAFATFAKVE